MKSDHEFPNLNKIATPADFIHPTFETSRRLREHYIYTESEFARELHWYDRCDVMTYSVSPAFTYCKIDRLIYCEGLPPHNVKQKLKLYGTHTKLYLCYKRNQTIPKHIFIGSANATAMSIHDLVIRALPSQHEVLTHYFNQIWKLNQPRS